MKEVIRGILQGLLICAIALFLFFAGAHQSSRDYNQGYKDGKDFVCNSPQVPFRTVNLPACAAANTR